MNDREFFEKVDWEGGYAEACRYGIKPSEIKNKKLKELWSKFCELQKEANKIADEIEEMRAE